MRNYLLSFFILITFGLTAQNHVYSPYSYYGIGLPAPQNGTFSQTMGGIGQGIAGNNYVNTANPASYAFNQKVNFEFNIYGKLNTLQDSAGYHDYKTYNFGRMNLAFPIGKKKNAGACFGVTPATFAGYEMSRSFASPTAHTDYYTGEGGLSKVFLGAGYSLGKHLAIGANSNFSFGDLKYKRVTIFDSTSLNNYYVESNTIIRALNFDLGLQFRHYKQTIKDSVKYRKEDSVYVKSGKIKSGKDSLVHVKRYGYKKDIDTILLVFNWGVTYSTGRNANATRDLYGVTFKNYILPFASKNVAVLDTVAYTVDEAGKVNLPGSLGIGFTLSNKHKSDDRNNFLIGADFKYSNWSSYKNFGSSDSLHQSYTVCLGGYYKPAKPYRTDYFNQIEYRIGGHFTQTPLSIRQTAINEYGLSVGLGLPLLFKNHNSGIINLAFEAGRMGTTQNNLTTDSYFKLSLGFNLLSDQWFQHYKYD